MKAILIDVKNREVKEVEIDGSKNVLQQWYKLMDVSMVEVATYINEQNDSILVDEEGLMNATDETKFFTFKGAHQPFAGNGLVVGVDKEGESISCHVDVEEIKAKVKFL